MSGKLAKSIVYLSGPIDNAKDFGKGWRENFIDNTKHLNMSIINPCNKPASCVHEVTGDVRTVSKIRESENWKEMQDFVKQFRREDLRFTDVSDFLVAYIDADIPSWGTPDEIYTAERQKKPILAIVNGGIKRLPTWLFGVFRIDEIFSTVEECINHLNKIDSGEIKMDRRWVLFRQQMKDQI
jgi:hypothetical protein